MVNVRTRALGGVLVAAALLVTACGGSPGSAEKAASPSDPAAVSGEITVLTNRTDLVGDGTMKRYAAEFTKVYPHVSVKFQAITDYEGEVKIRMNTSNYGDVLLIPNVIAKNSYPTFFAPLGSATSLAQKYRFTGKGEVNGSVYGLASFGAANGFVYNKDVWKRAGVTAWPTTPAQFLGDLAAIKAKGGATPYYTNYKDGWPLTKWTDVLGSPSCDPRANDKLATAADPWAAGSDLRIGDGLLYDIVHGKLAEPDPSTTNWEDSKGQLATGKIATMWLGSWAVAQLQDAAKKAGKDPASIGFMPFPAQSAGKFCPVILPDYLYAVSSHSEHKQAARAWIDWTLDKSGYAEDNQAVSTVKAAPLPAALGPFTAAGVNFVELSQASAAKVNAIDNASEVGLTKPDYRQHLIDIARGAASGNLDSTLAGLGKKWADGAKAAE
ncbi:MAG: hypothetical protein QOJ50_1542 [Cryptosporangiaceae bacterium]|nr:hypothetical protein [Cryptosporangiaceae bacterium]